MNISILSMAEWYNKIFYNSKVITNIVQFQLKSLLHGFRLILKVMFVEFQIRII